MTGRTGGGPVVAVVGSGISGLSAALRLATAGIAVELIERDRVLGGRFGAAELGDRKVMLGGKNVGRRYTSFRAFTAALGDHPYEPFGINASRVTDGEVVTLDSSRRGRSLRGLLGAGAARDLLRLAYLAARIRLRYDNRFLGSPLFTRVSRRHDRAPLSAYFGAELTRQLLRPMTIRMNGAEPDEVYPGTFGTNLALLMDTYDQLVHGIQPVLDALSGQVTVRTGCRVDGVVLREGRLAGLRIAGPAREHAYDGVVLATPAYAASDILRSACPRLSDRLAQVRYFPSTVVLVEYDRPVFTPEVRALVMEDGPCSNAGAYGVDDRHIVRYTFSGQHARLLDPAPDQVEAWVAEAEKRLDHHLGIGHLHRVRSVSRTWPAAYCGYLPFHADFLSDVRGAVAGVPGLELAGDYLRGVNLEACCRSGEDAAARLTAHLGSS
jgi:protoporphyrinogen/coproporphyrinogen III oxidase